MTKNKLGIIGMAVMGKNLALNFADKGYQLAVYNRSEEPLKKALEEDATGNLEGFSSLKDFVESLEKPRRVLLMIKSGDPVDQMCHELLKYLEKDDIIMDAGNSYYKDTIRRTNDLLEHGINFLGVGVSGGEEGARLGPAIMPGGDKEAYAHVKELLEAVSAKNEEGGICCKYAGTDGAGHYVKMVHNSIEYGDMQIIAEMYLILREAFKINNDQMAKEFEYFKDGIQSGYLLDIAVNVLKEKDEDGSYLLENIKDKAKHKGTGKWAALEAIDLGVETSVLVAGLSARVISSMFDDRKEFSELYPKKEHERLDIEVWRNDIKKALLLSKIIAYAQGFSLLREAAVQYNWDFDYKSIAEGFTAGCILQGRLLKEIMDAYKENPKLSNLLLSPVFEDVVKDCSLSLRKVVSKAFELEIPIPALSSGLSYYDSLKTYPGSANMIQGLRDYFGAHTFERVDREGTFHHKWNR